MSLLSLKESSCILVIFLFIQLLFRTVYTIIESNILHTSIAKDIFRLIRELFISLTLLYTLKFLGHFEFISWSVDLTYFTLFLIILLIMLTIENVFLVKFITTNNTLIEAISQYPLSQITSIILISPVIEELIFRKVIIGILFANNLIIGVLVSSLLFGILHLQFKLIDFSLIVIYGIILGLSYITTHNILTPIILHIIVNSSQLVILTYSDEI